MPRSPSCAFHSQIRYVLLKLKDSEGQEVLNYTNPIRKGSRQVQLPDNPELSRILLLHLLDIRKVFFLKKINSDCLSAGMWVIILILFAGNYPVFSKKPLKRPLNTQSKLHR